MSKGRALQSVGALGAGLAGLAVRDLLQRRHSILRNYPSSGTCGSCWRTSVPSSSSTSSSATGTGAPTTGTSARSSTSAPRASTGAGRSAPNATSTSRGTSTSSTPPPRWPAPDEPPRVRGRRPGLRQPYAMALLNVSAMSFGALSANAIRALNKGAAMGGFAHDTGEGGLSPYHLEHGGDLVWEIGTRLLLHAHEGRRVRPGDEFADKAAHDQVKCVSLKLSQGAKPGIGGVLPAAKVTAEIAEIREVPQGEKCVSPPSHSVFSTPRRAGRVHRPDARALRWQAGRVQAVRGVPGRRAGHRARRCSRWARPRTSSSSTARRAAPARRRWSTRTTSGCRSPRG